MLQKLTDFYKRNGILSTSFTCKFKSECKQGCRTFTGPKSTFVSHGYEHSELPRLLFVSLDSGYGQKNPADVLPEAVRKSGQLANVNGFHKGRHWYKTHELAWYIFKQFNPKIKLEEVNKHFAHANSAKCCMNKPGAKEADKALFRNCRGYLQEELSILQPEIIVTQGAEAKKAMVATHEKVVRKMDDFASIIRINRADVFWLHTHHPSSYGPFYSQYDYDKVKKVSRAWLKYAQKMHKFILNKK